MGYDQITFNKISTLDAEARRKQSAYEVAKAVRDALASRVSRFEVELATAKADLNTAQSNYSAALKTEKSVRGALKAALTSARQAMIVYAYVKRVFRLSHSAANQAIQAGYTISSMLSEVSAAEAKNSYITPRLLKAAQDADSSAATAVTAATTALQDTMAALVAAERAVWATCLILAGSMNLQRLTGGYRSRGNSDEDGIPDALLVVPQPKLHQLELTSNPGEAPNRGQLDTQVDEVLTEWIRDFSQTPARVDQADEEDDNREGSVERLLALLFPEGQKLPKKGLTQLLDEIQEATLTDEEEIDDATTEAKVELARAEQEMARRLAERDAVLKALTAAKQAA